MFFPPWGNTTKEIPIRGVFVSSKMFLKEGSAALVSSPPSPFPLLLLFLHAFLFLFPANPPSPFLQTPILFCTSRYLAFPTPHQLPLPLFRPSIPLPMPSSSPSFFPVVVVSTHPLLPHQLSSPWPLLPPHSPSFLPMVPPSPGQYMNTVEATSYSPQPSLHHA